MRRPMDYPTGYQQGESMFPLGRLKFIALFTISLGLGFHSSAKASDLGDQLSQAFRARISYLDRELMTFRYETKDLFEPQVLSDFKGRVSFKTNRFSKKSVVTPELMAGPGTYVAIDPYATRGYGGSDPQLYLLPMKKGTTILNLSAQISPSEQAIIKKAHDQLQCKQSGDYLIPEFQMSFFSLRNSATEACRHLAIEVAATLKAQAIMYTYSASNDLADCRQRRVAFNIISASAINFDRSAFYSNSSLLENSLLAPFVKSMFEEAASNWHFRFNGFQPQPLPLKLQEISSDHGPNYADWKAKNILNCGPNWSLEGPVTNTYADAVNINFKTNYQDFEIQEMLIAFKLAFDKKANFKTLIQLTEFRNIAKLIFLASGFADNEESFIKWLGLEHRQYSDPAIREEFLRLYEMDVKLANFDPNQNSVTELVKSMTIDEIKSIDFFPRIYSSLGIKDGYQIYLINKVNSGQGGAYILSPDTNLSLQERLTLSKSIYKAALQTCIDIYSNDQISYEDAQKTECAQVLH